ncbi:L-lactate dehydrogenase complex protein LldG [Natronoarchaeum philippinense]|uniref:L-lactate dehydrogenase complex protein LldG n=1 Tax=Natronoarchaeum philippinense TaxID=558529 RepID=A0A285P5P1_NATPI|nr:LUD domain-containing protein [Natronoarchaeum philippinense]SNZ15191.1 L-lactate dehydrogenase complex protein LldG [Natronoarchaeum philippinense]
MASALSTFESSLDELGVSVTNTTAEAFGDRLDDVIVEAAVGVSLDRAFDEPDLSLDAAAVEVDPTPASLRAATTGVTGASLGVADYGSLALTLTDRASELVSLFVERHVAVVRAADIVADMDAAVEDLHETFNDEGGSAILATGPSATADMGALVKGAHGPKDVHVIVVEEGP